MYSNTVYINGLQQGFKLIKLVPTSIINEATIVISSPGNEEVQLVVTDQSGKTIKIMKHFVQEGNNAVPFQCGELRSGIYIISVQDKKGKRQLIRFVKL